MKSKDHWEKEVAQSWIEFKEFIDNKSDFTSQDFINFLSFNLESKNYAVSTLVNLKSRLQIAYKNEYDKNFQVEFPEVLDFCKALSSKKDHSTAYYKKKDKDWKKFKSAVGKGLEFTEEDLIKYFDDFQKEKQLSNSSLRLILAAIADGYNRETAMPIPKGLKSSKNSKHRAYSSIPFNHRYSNITNYVRDMKINKTLLSSKLDPS